MNLTVTIATLHHERNIRGLRDAWFLARNGKMINRVLTLRGVELNMQSDPKAAFKIVHADDYETPAECWRPLIWGGRMHMPSKGGTTYFRGAKKDAALLDARQLRLLENRLDAYEENQAGIIASIQRLQTALTALDDSGTERPEVHAATRLLEELCSQAAEHDSDIAQCRRQIGQTT